jgi:hypothetical protein
VGFGPLEPRGALVGFEPGAQVLAGVEPIDDPVLAGGRALGAENLGAQVPRKAARSREDALQELLVIGLVTGLHPPDHGGRDRTVGVVG